MAQRLPAPSATGIPEALHNIPDEMETRAARTNGVPAIRWGWPQWRKLAPLIAGHVLTYGREGLAAVLDRAQRKVLTASERKAYHCLQQMCTPTNYDRVDIRAIVQHLIDTGQMQRPANAPQSSVVALPVRKPRAAREARVVTAAANDTPSTIAPALPALPAELSALMALPLSAVVPALRTFAVSVMRDVLNEHRAEVAALIAQHRAEVSQTVRSVVVDVIGGPSEPTPPPTSEARREPQAADPPPVAAVKPDPDPAPASDPSPAAAAAAAPAEPAPAPTHTDTPPAAKPSRRDFREQLAQVAETAGIPLAQRHSVVVVGIHHKVQDELEHRYGRFFRFTFRRPDAFRDPSHLPPSTDALVLARKVLPHDLAALVRRYAIPTRNVENNAAAVMAALSGIFPEVEVPGIAAEFPEPAFGGRERVYHDARARM